MDTIITDNTKRVRKKGGESLCFEFLPYITCPINYDKASKASRPVKTCSGEIWTNWVELAGDGSGWNPLDAASALLALLVSYDS